MIFMDENMQIPPEINRVATNLKKLNKMFQKYVNQKTSIDFKTCQKVINTGRKAYPTRTGHFVFNQEKHRELILNQGYYIFIVFDGKLIIQWKMTQAQDIYYQDRIKWNKIIPE